MDSLSFTTFELIRPTDCKFNATIRTIKLVPLQSYRSDRDSYPRLTEGAWPCSTRNKPGMAYYAFVVNNNPRAGPCQTQPPPQERCYKCTVLSDNGIPVVCTRPCGKLDRSTGKHLSGSPTGLERG